MSGGLNCHFKLYDGRFIIEINVMNNIFKIYQFNLIGIDKVYSSHFNEDSKQILTIGKEN